MKGALKRLADAPRQMDIGRVNHNPVRFLLDTHDAVERMFLFSISS